MEAHGRGKTIGHGQRSRFICLERYFLTEHHIAFSQAPDRYEAPSSAEPSAAIDLVDIGRRPPPDTVSRAGVASYHLEISLSSELNVLLGRKPAAKQPPRARMARLFFARCAIQLGDRKGPQPTLFRKRVELSESCDLAGPRPYRRRITPWQSVHWKSSRLG